MKKKLLALAIASSFLGLTACGGGGSGDSSSTDSSSDSAPSVTNSAPVANAGLDQNVNTNTLVTLDGSSSSDPDSDQITYSWSIVNQPSGSSINLSDATSPMPEFTPSIDGVYEFELVVNDGSLSSNSDTVIITTTTANSAPVANAGANQNVATGNLVTLDGAQSSDADGDQLSYSWSFTTIPAGSIAELSDANTVSPSFVPDIDGEYLVSLTVNDGLVNSEADEVAITSTYINSAPVADAGTNQTVIQGDVVYLDGSSSSDNDGDQLNYQWSFVSVPSNSSATLSNEQTATPNFTTDKSGIYVLSLTVNDGTANSNADNISIEAIEPEIKLYRDSSSYGSPTYSETSMPYSTSGTISASVSGIPTPTTYTIGSFKLQSVGDNFTIVNLSAVDNTSTVNPYFDGLSNGRVINNDSEVEFELVSPLTGNQTTDLVFQFEIAETGETFYARYQLTTN